MASVPIPSSGDSSPIVRFCPQCHGTISERWRPSLCPRCTAKISKGSARVGNYHYVPVWQLAGELGVSESIIRGAVGKGLLRSKNRLIDGKTVVVVQRQETYPFRSNKGEGKPIDIRPSYPEQRVLAEESRERNGYSKLDQNVMLYLIKEVRAGLELLADYVLEKGE